MTTYDAVVEIYVDGAWLDITRLDDDTRVLGEVTITRGASDQQGEPVPTTAQFRYLDNNLTLDGENPRSAYYRKISVPGTPLRVKLDGEIRASLEIVAMPITPGETPEINEMTITAAGLLRQYDQGQPPLRSAAYRAFTAMVNDPYRVMYVPLEEESEATTVSVATGGAVTLGGPGTVSFGAVESMSSARLAQFGSFDTFITFVLPPWTNTLDQHLAGSLVRWPEAGLLNNAIIWRWYFTGGGIDYVDLLHTTGDVLQLQFYAAGAVVSTICTSDWTGILDDREAFLFCTFHQNGADIDARIRATTATSWLLQVSGTAAGLTLGRMYQIVMGTGSGVDGMGFGHLIVGSNKDAFGNFIDDLDSSSEALVTGARGYNLETAGARIQRLADEEDIPITVTGTATDTERLAPQGIDTLLGLIRTAARVDLGILAETRIALQLNYRTRANLYNQAPTAQLTLAHLQPGFRPTSDDLRVVNDFTANRPSGSSAHYAIPDGDVLHYSTEAPPDGAGFRPNSGQIEVGSDDQLNNQAAWRAHLGSWRERRFSAMTFELAKAVFDAADVAAVHALDLGDVISFDMTGAPAYVPYNELRLMVRGYTETLSKFLHTITFDTIPADMYEVAQVDSGPTSTLANVIDDNDTSLKLAPGAGKPWSESSTDLPYNIQVNGDPATITAISTDTPAFIAAGTASHASNASVTPGLPAGMTPDVGQLMVMVAAIRNSGTGTVNTPTGWTRLDTVGVNLGVFGRYYRTGDAAPTVTFTGGVANADTSARIAAFSGLSMALDHELQASLNSSAANVAYAAMPVRVAGGGKGVRRTNNVTLIAAWKQDDTTGVTAASGFTEAFEASTTTGDDQSIALDYRLDTAAVATATGSKTWGGGAAAISRTFVLALRPLQTATVTRGIAGVAAARTVGDEVHGWRMGITGL